MSISIIQQKLLEYQCQSVLEQEHALKEIAQDIALLALSRAGFFRIAAFHGGTCLRILYNLQRFSEDLDFVLLEPDPNFSWEPYLKHMANEFSTYGYTLEMKPKKNLGKTVKSTFLKADSQGGLLVLTDIRTNRPKIRIKLEIDTHPPAGSQFELKYLDFPLSYGVLAQDKASLFASKCHALLCRNYIKGRDWFDFLWYVARKTDVNFILLKNALLQNSPWQQHSLSVTPEWFIDQLQAKINQIDWENASKDVAQFISDKEQTNLALWSTEFFSSCLEKLANYLPHRELQ